MLLQFPDLLLPCKGFLRLDFFFFQFFSFFFQNLLSLFDLRKTRLFPLTLFFFFDFLVQQRTNIKRCPFSFFQLPLHHPPVLRLLFFLFQLYTQIFQFFQFPVLYTNLIQLLQRFFLFFSQLLFFLLLLPFFFCPFCYDSFQIFQNFFRTFLSKRFHWMRFFPAGQHLFSSYLTNAFFFFFRRSFFLQFVCKDFIKSGIKYFPEHFTAFAAFRKKQFQKFSLSDHGHLLKLPIIQTHKVFHFLIDCPAPGDQHLIRSFQYRLILSVPVKRSGNLIPFSFMCKQKAHTTVLFFLCIITAEIFCFADIPTGRIIQRKHHPIKNRSLSGTGIPANQKKSCTFTFLKRNQSRLCIRSKSLQFQFQRSHTSTCTSRISSRRISFSVSFKGTPFCFS